MNGFNASMAHIAGFLSIAGMTLASCQADLIEPPVSEEYTREFINQFGVFDPEQDWTMATRVRAVVDPAVTQGGKSVYVFNRMPGSDDCQLAARYSASAREFSFDFPKGARNAYVMVRDDEGRTSYAGYLPINDGQLDITGAKVRSRADAPAVSLVNLNEVNKSIGYLSVEDYNRAFWTGKVNIIEPDPNPPVQDPKEEVTLFTGSTTLSGWSGEVTNCVTIDHSNFANIDRNRVKLTVTYEIPEGFGDKREFSVKSDANGWAALEACYSAPGWEGSSIVVKAAGTLELTLAEKDINTLKGDNIHMRIQGNGVTITSVKMQELANVVTPEKPKARLTDVFTLYGMSTTSTTDWNGFKGSYLKGTLSGEDKVRTISDMVPIVGSTGVFHESVTNSQCNLDKYKEQLHPELGVVYEVKEKSPVSLEYFYGATAHYDSFGYFYYQAGESEEAIMRKPKFLLMYDACPGTNLRIDKNDGSGWQTFSTFKPDPSNGGMDTEDGWQRWKGLSKLVSDAEGITEGDKTTAANTRVLSTNYNLVYYELDSDNKPIESSASYEFPAGTRIGFFMITGGQYRLDANSESTAIDGGGIAFSLPWMNTYVGNIMREGHSHNGDTYNAGNGAVAPWTAFVTYLWNGQYVLGTEDATQWGDHDMNDVLFVVNGNVETENKTEELGNKYSAQSWILAVEDLGGAFDYDFNDVVVGISHIATDGVGADEFTVTPLAAGGMLPVYLHYNDGTGDRRITEDEFHSLFGVNSETMYNTGGFNGVGEKIKVTCPKDFTLSGYVGISDYGKAIGGFTVEVEKGDGTTQIVGLKEGENQSPQILLLPGQWKWPTERTRISDAYGKFTDWVQNAADNQDWTEPQNYDGSKVVSHGWSPTDDYPKSAPAQK